jgi:hypothetical protein
VGIDVKVYDNGDHTCLVWLPSNGQAIPNCRGFTIQRTLKTAAGGQAVQSYLHGFVGFSDDDKLDPSAPWKFPLQRYMWWDYGVAPGNEAQYSVIPVCGPDKDHLALSLADASAPTPPMIITGQASAHVSAYFNKGIVSAQWVSRALEAIGQSAKISTVIAQPGNTLRNALSGLLRPQLLGLLDDVKKNNGEIYAALYELNDPELIPRLLALGQKCHLILANGAFKPPANDENKDVRAQLRGKVDLHDRLVSNPHFAHNKFVVACDSGGNPQRVLSGSTNWTQTGLCTQANNGIIVEDPALGAFFIKEWNLLKDAGNAYPATLAQANSKPSSLNLDGGTITQWFAPTQKGEDLDYARQLINGAKQGILFLFFNPGAFEPEDKPEQWTLLQNILARHQPGAANCDQNLYIRGVVNQEIPGLTTEGSEKPSRHAALDPTNASPVKLYSGGNTAPMPVTYDSMVPKAIKDAFHNWQTEVMNQGVHVHSKVIVIDAFGAKPVVITGSHNLGYKASTKNDDNMMIVEGNAPLAASYAANIIAIYQTYRWNSYVDAHAKDPQSWHGPVDSAAWQVSYLKSGSPDLAEIKFWLGEGPSAPAAAGQPVAPAPSGGSQVRAATATGPSQHGGARRRRSAANKPSAKGAPTKWASAKRRASARKTPARKTPARKTPARKASVKRAPAKARLQARNLRTRSKRSAKVGQGKASRPVSGSAPKRR